MNSNLHNILGVLLSLSGKITKLLDTLPQNACKRMIYYYYYFVSRLDEKLRA